MSAKDLGTKYTCFKCAVKFYDMKRPEPLCPKCGADQRETPPQKSVERAERRKAMRALAETQAVESTQEGSEEEVELPDDEEGEDEAVEEEDDDL